MLQKYTHIFDDFYISVWTFLDDVWYIGKSITTCFYHIQEPDIDELCFCVPCKLKVRIQNNQIQGTTFNTLRPRQHGCHFPDDIFRCILLNENIWIAINISQSFLLKGPIDNIPVLVQIMAWRRPGDKPLSEPTMVSLLTHICVTRPQWV